jgi:hypothetical protein
LRGNKKLKLGEGNVSKPKINDRRNKK